jgi:hypothetical protein
MFAYMLQIYHCEMLNSLRRRLIKIVVYGERHIISFADILPVHVSKL